MSDGGQGQAEDIWVKKPEMFIQPHEDWAEIRFTIRDAQGEVAFRSRISIATMGLPRALREYHARALLKERAVWWLRGRGHHPMEDAPTGTKLDGIPVIDELIVRAGDIIADARSGTGFAHVQSIAVADNGVKTLHLKYGAPRPAKAESPSPEAP